MANVFLDANVLIDILEERSQFRLEDLTGCEVFYSPLSVHILSYLYKYKMPNEYLADLLDDLTAVNFDQAIMNGALLGPTTDFEDNIQLLSAEKAECEFFLTSDKALLKMKKFEDLKIVNNLDNL